MAGVTRVSASALRPPPPSPKALYEVSPICRPLRSRPATSIPSEFSHTLAVAGLTSGRSDVRQAASLSAAFDLTGGGDNDKLAACRTSRATLPNLSFL